MKILSPPLGEGLLTDVEVLEFLREKNRENAEYKEEALSTGQRALSTPKRTRNLDQMITAALEDGPAGLQSIDSVRMLMDRLEKFHLAVTEVQMIANLRPDVLPRLMSIVEDCEERYSAEETEEIRGIIDKTLEKMPFVDEEEGGVEVQEEDREESRDEGLENERDVSGVAQGGRSVDRGME